MLRQKTRKIAQFINLLVIEPGRPGADFFCIVVPQPRPFADRHPDMLWACLLKKTKTKLWFSRKIAILQHLFEGYLVDSKGFGLLKCQGTR